MRLARKRHERDSFQATYNSKLRLLLSLRFRRKGKDASLSRKPIPGDGYSLGDTGMYKKMECFKNEGI